MLVPPFHTKNPPGATGAAPLAKICAKLRTLKAVGKPSDSLILLVVEPGVALHCRKVPGPARVSEIGVLWLAIRPIRTVPFCTFTIWLPPKLVPLKDTTVLMVVKLNELPRL